MGKHKDTVLFLGKAFLAAILVILLVQFIAEQEVCSVNVPLDKLPDGAKKILSGISQQDSWRCPYDNDFDVSFKFDIVALTEKTVENVTMFKVTMADKKPASNRDKVATETVTEVCGTKCHLKSCECVEKMITSSACMSTHSSAGLSRGTSLVTCLHSFWGSKLQVSSGTSVTTVSVLGKHSSGPGFSSQPDGPQSSLGTFLHSVSGEYFLTLAFLDEQTCLGHLVHFFSVV